MTEFGEVLVMHSADGTVATGTERDDLEARAALKASGFRWSRYLEAWFLPRTWGEAVRLTRVRGLEQRLGAQVTIEISSAPRRSAAEREEDQREQAAARAERMDARAAKAATAAEAAEGAYRAIADHIPLGQPILVGHHSQRRHERDIERMRGQMDRSASEHERAQAATASAARARRVAKGRVSVVTIGNRIDRLEAELRLLDRKLNGTGKVIHGQGEPASEPYAGRLRSRRAEVVDELEHNRALLKEAGGVVYTRETVKAGDLVRIRGLWYPVLRANVKSVSIPSPMAPEGSSWSNTSPWREISDHHPRSALTGEQVKRIAANVPASFSGLRSRLQAIADELSTASEDATSVG